MQGPVLCRPTKNVRQIFFNGWRIVHGAGGGGGGGERKEGGKGAKKGGVFLSFFCVFWLERKGKIFGWGVEKPNTTVHEQGKILLNPPLKNNFELSLAL